MVNLNASDETLPTPSQRQLLEALTISYIQALKKNTEQRFKEASPILKCLQVFDILELPRTGSEVFQQYGCTWIERLGQHMYDDDEDLQTKLLAEWQLAKYDLAVWRQDMPQLIRDGIGYATEWCLIKLQNPSMKDHYRLLSVVAEMALVLPVSNVWPERAASILNWKKNRLRSKVKNDLLSSLLHISLNGHDIASPTYKQFMQEIVELWLAEKKRRKLPKQPISQANTDAMPLEENVVEVAREGDAEPSTDNFLTVLNLASEETGDSESDEECDG